MDRNEGIVLTRDNSSENCEKRKVMVKVDDKVPAENIFFIIKINSDDNKSNKMRRGDFFNQQFYIKTAKFFLWLKLILTFQ